MLWIFQGKLNTDENKEFESVIKEIGDEFQQVAPFTPAAKFPYRNDMIVFGCLSFCRDAVNAGWRGVYCNLRNFKCINYYGHYYKYLMNQNSIFLPFGMLKQSKDRLYNMLGIGDCIFIRPSSGFKDFTGQIVEKYRFEKDIDSFGHYDFDAGMMCVVSSPTNILSEYRLWVAGNEIIGKSSYRINKALNHYAEVPESVTDFASNVLKNVEWKPDPLFVMDVAEYYENGETKIGIVELNSFSASGFYNGLDKKSFIEKAREYIILDMEKNYGI